MVPSIPFYNRRRTRWAIAAVLLALLALVWLVAGRLGRDDAEYARAYSNSQDSAVKNRRASSNGSLGAWFATNERGAPSGIDAEPETLTFAELNRLFGVDDTAAARRFHKAVSRDPTVPEETKAGMERELDDRGLFHTFLGKLTDIATIGLRKLAGDVMKHPPTEEKLRTALITEREGGRILVRGSGLGVQGSASARSRSLFSRLAAGWAATGGAASEGGANAGSPGGDSENRSGPNAHDVDTKLRKAKWDGRDSVGFLAALFAGMGQSDLDNIAGQCISNTICDPGNACDAAGVWSKCKKACDNNPGKCSGICAPGTIKLGANCVPCSPTNTSGQCVGSCAPGESDCGGVCRIGTCPPTGPGPASPGTGTTTTTGTGTTTTTGTGTTTTTGTGTDVCPPGQTGTPPDCQPMTTDCPGGPSCPRPACTSCCIVPGQMTPTCQPAGCTRAPGQCIAAGTGVATPGGDRPIESLHVGDAVWSVDERTGLKVEARVRRVIRHDEGDTLRIRVEGGRELLATGEHPLYDFDARQYRSASGLRPTDRLAVELDGTLLPTRVISVVPGPRSAVFDITVDGPFHNFVAGGILVHNKPSCD